MEAPSAPPPPPPPPPPPYPPQQPADPQENGEADLLRQIQEMRQEIGQLKNRARNKGKGRPFPGKIPKKQKPREVIEPTCTKCGDKHATHACPQIISAADKLYAFLREGYCLRCNKRHLRPCRSNEPVCTKCGDSATVVHNETNCFMD